MNDIHYFFITTCGCLIANFKLTKVYMLVVHAVLCRHYTVIR